MEQLTLTKGKTAQIFLCDIAKGLFTGMMVNYFLYIYQPTVESSLPILIANHKFLSFITVLGIITGLSKVIDALTDPLVAHLSDKSKNKNGRRIPFMKFAAIPFALSAVLVFLAPFEARSIGNTLWVGFFFISYYVFYTIYYIPQRALIPELITDPNKRINAYTLSTVFFMGSSAVMYATPLFVSGFTAMGASNLWAWRYVFIIFGIIGIICLLASAFAINEKDYLKSTVVSRDPFFKSMKSVLKNKNFLIVTIGDLFNYTAMAFFQTSMMYYITVLLGLPEDQSIFVMGTAIVTAIFIFFPLIMKVSKKFNKKTPLQVGVGMFAILFGAIYFGDVIPLPPMVLGIAMGLMVAYPFAALNILPQAIIADIIQEDSLRNGANREGIFAATKTFLEKMAYAIAMVVVSSVLTIGAIAGADEEIGLLGVKITGAIAGGFSLLGFITLWFYNDKGVTAYIKEHKLKAQSAIDISIDLDLNQPPS